MSTSGKLEGYSEIRNWHQNVTDSAIIILSLFRDSSWYTSCECGQCSNIVAAIGVAGDGDLSAPVRIRGSIPISDTG